tara:strand:+ start:50 stop:1090 length:1041 start_codon:yes stop_codon:yes gene_type:complete
MKVIKIISLNLFFFLILFLLIELIFGYWFDKDNLGPYMREHRMKKNPISLKFENKNYDFIYKRNYHGFRGEEIAIENIKMVLIGGSTADERYKPFELTITGLVNKKLKENKSKLRLVNAGIEGQSTKGHIFNFENWFPKLKKFNPEYFIFYIGINDHLANPDKNQISDGHVANPSKIEFIKDNLKSRSLIYDLLRKVKHKYYINDEKKVSYDFDKSINDYTKGKFDFLAYDDAIKIHNLKNLKKKHKKLIKTYLNNVDKLVDYSKEYNAKPIFINQLTYEGSRPKKLFILNYTLIEHCKKKKYFCIDLAKELKGKKEFWWDGVHTTPAGSKQIVEIIYPKLINFLK